MEYVQSDSNGKILAYVSIPDEDTTALNYFQSDYTTTPYSGIVSESSHYVYNGVVIERPTFNITQSDNVFSGIPSGATIKIHSAKIAEQEFTADGTDITITPEIPGIYTVKINLWPYQEEEITIEYNG